MLDALTVLGVCQRRTFFVMAWLPLTCFHPDRIRYTIIRHPSDCSDDRLPFRSIGNSGTSFDCAIGAYGMIYTSQCAIFQGFNDLILDILMFRSSVPDQLRGHQLS